MLKSDIESGREGAPSLAKFLLEKFSPQKRLQNGVSDPPSIFRAGIYCSGIVVIIVYSIVAYVEHMHIYRAIIIIIIKYILDILNTTLGLYSILGV